MNGARLTLDPRLTAMARMAGRCARFADIGADHGRLGAYMLQNGLCERAQLTDISADSLAKARRLIVHLCLEDRVDLFVGDGAEALREEPDVAVIAGMGGETIAAIVERGRARLRNARLILQPNVDAPDLRRRLVASGYRIADEAIVRDGRRLYVIIAAEPGTAEYREMEICVGPILLERKPPELMAYARFRLRVARKALSGAAGRNPAVEAELIREIGIWEEVEACL